MKKNKKKRIQTYKCVYPSGQGVNLTFPFFYFTRKHVSDIHILESILHLRIICLEINFIQTLELLLYITKL